MIMMLAFSRVLKYNDVVQSKMFLEHVSANLFTDSF